MEPFIIILFIIGIALFFVLAGFLERQRREKFRKLAQELGLRFSLDDWSIERRYGFLKELLKGDRRRASMTLSGEYRGYWVEAFEYVYETYGTDSKGNRTTNYNWSNHYVLTERHPDAPLPYPELRVYPETLLSRIGQALGFDDIDFESIEFSKAFTVRSKDKRFAYDILNPRIMELLLEDKRTLLEVEDQYMALSYDHKFLTSHVKPRLDRLIAIRERFPEYLFDGSQ